MTAGRSSPRSPGADGVRPDVVLLVPGDPGQLTGGYLYDARIASVLRARGRTVQVQGLAGRFPDADDEAARSFAAALADCAEGQVVVVDGLALGGLPRVAAQHAQRLHLVALVHHPLADEYGISPQAGARLLASERLALSTVTHIIATSAFTARHLADAYGVAADRLSVVEPGLDSVTAHLAASHEVAGRTMTGPAPRLLCVATLVPRKGHLVLVEALARLRDLDWQCDCVGDTQRDVRCTADVREAIVHHRLEDRVHLAGRLAAGALDARYRAAEVFVLASWYEGYGMVIGEALAHGLPVVTTTGGALAQTLPAASGLLVPPGDARTLAAALRRVLTDESLRHALRAGARRAARMLPDWDEQGARFAAVLDQVAARGIP